jgi:hypothetical protein
VNRAWSREDGALFAAVPRWLTWSLLLAVLAGVLFLVGWIKPYLEGPDLAITTIYRPRPVPVQIETVKWLTKVETRTVKERVEIPVEVIRELPAKEARRLENDFGITIPELRADSRELVDILTVPKAPHGGEMALTVNTGTGDIDGIFRAKRAPFVQLGGVREAGVAYSVIDRSAEGYYRQDLVRVGPAVVHGRAFATTTGDYGVTVGVGVRF